MAVNMAVIVFVVGEAHEGHRFVGLGVGAVRSIGVASLPLGGIQDAIFSRPDLLL
ncbi:MAG TPA: hypothetical protein VIU62_08295 [Chloroflexota bacterium]